MNDQQAVAQLRQTGIGASEIASALGCGRQSPLELYELKVSPLPPEEPEETEEDLYWGQVMEPVLVSEYQRRAMPGARLLNLPEFFGPERLRPSIRGQIAVVHPEVPWLWSTPDGCFRPEVGQPRGLEAKNRTHWMAHEWGEPFSDQLPDDVALQCLGGMLCTGFREWGIAVYFGGSDFRTYLMEWDDELAGVVMDQLARFWGHVEAREPPPLGDKVTDATHRALARLFPQLSTQLIQADPATDARLAEYFELYAAKKEVEQALSVARGELELVIGQQYGLQGGKGKVIWPTTKPQPTTDWEAVARELADMVERVGSPSFHKQIEEQAAASGKNLPVAGTSAWPGAISGYVLQCAAEANSAPRAPFRSFKSYPAKDGGQ